ncbi:MAG: CDP-alcohol phosphatidyltransferase family protein [Candidatus Saccharimonadales bacterium]
MKKLSMPSNKLKSVIEPNYFSNWGDLWYPKFANKLLKPASKIKALTPNMVTISSLLLYALAAVLIVVGGWWSILAALLLPFSYVLDCLDGQLARYTGKTSSIGDYLDKTLDVLKLGIICFAMAIAAYNLTDKTYYLLLGFIACFGILFRYYIKLETMFAAINRDKDYLNKSRLRRQELYASLEAKKLTPKTGKQRLLWLWFRHRSVFALDEAEFVTFGALAALVSRPDLWCWLFAVGQITIAVIRLVERGHQSANNPSSLTYPLRK